MPRTHIGRVALPVIFGIGAFTGILTYFLFSQAAPGHSIFTPSMFFQPLPPPLIPPSETLPETSSTEGGENTGKSTTAINSENQTNNTSQIPANAVTIDILKGAAVQGNPAYQPDDAKAGIDSTMVVWKNDDSVPHTATSGAGPDDSNAGKQFNSGLLDPGADYSIATNKIGSGEHPYFCQVHHPYMKGKITIS
jgi:plastocyanin